MALSEQSLVENLRLSVDDFRQRLQAGKEATIIDVRNPKAWGSSDARIPGAIRVDPVDVHADPAWPKDRLTVFYCTCPGDQGAVAWAQILREEGFTDAYALVGGFDAWVEAGLPIEPKDNPPVRPKG